MNWLSGINNSVQYIESHLTDAIGLDTLSKIAGCSSFEFSRIFSYVTDMHVSEYIRRRRLTQAAFDLQNERERIIDIAMKYRYESPTAFSRAFAKLHGVSPLVARKSGATLKNYPPINLEGSIKGVDGMEYKIVKRGAFRFMAVLSYTGALFGATLPWKIEQTVPYMLAVIEPIPGGSDALITVGFDERAIPERPERKYQIIPAANWAVFPFNDKQESAMGISAAYNRILTEWLPSSGYTLDSAAPYLERFSNSSADGDISPWEIWMAVNYKQ